MESLDVNVDVIVLSEALKLIEKNNFNSSNYNIFYNERQLNAPDGCVIYAKNNLNLIRDIVNVRNSNFL